MTRSGPLTPDQIQLIKANIHPPARGAIMDWDTFSWHRNRAGRPDAHVRNSSQAFCISVWGTLARTDARNARTVLAALLGDEKVSEALESPPELHLEYADRDLLNEKGAGTTPTTVDALLRYPGVSLVVESKLTEQFQRCSQVSPGHCSGRYEVGSDLKTSSEALCRLEIQDRQRTPRRYWEVMRRLSVRDTYRPGRTCPFSGPTYQVMRNIAVAAAFAERTGKDWRTVFAFPGSLSPESRSSVEAVAARLRPEHQERVLQLDYDELAAGLQDVEDPVAKGLAHYMSSRLGGSFSAAQEP